MDCLLRLFHVKATLCATAANDIFYGITRELHTSRGKTHRCFHMSRGGKLPQRLLYIIRRQIVMLKLHYVRQRGTIYFTGLRGNCIHHGGKHTGVFICHAGGKTTPEATVHNIFRRQIMFSCITRELQL
jgi:hypothetical protein